MQSSSYKDIKNYYNFWVSSLPFSKDKGRKKLLTHVLKFYKSIILHGQLFENLSKTKPYIPIQKIFRISIRDLQSICTTILYIPLLWKCDTHSYPYLPKNKGKKTHPSHFLTWPVIRTSSVPLHGYLNVNYKDSVPVLQSMVWRGTLLSLLGWGYKDAYSNSQVSNWWGESGSLLSPTLINSALGI